MAKPAGPSTWLERLWRSHRGGAVAGALAAAVIAVCANILVMRFYKRWDLTSAGLYTLSSATVETLHSLQDPVDIIVFLSASDPLTLSVQHMLAAYGAETRLLKPRFVDPDSDPAEFLALQKEYGIVAGKTEDGRIVTDASIVIARADKHWFVTTEDMVVYNEEDNSARPALEQALTEGIRNVLGTEKTEVCFTTGHQEVSADDGGPQGLAELKFRIQKDNYESRTVDLASPSKTETLAGCQVVVVAGPEVPFAPSAAKRLVGHFDRGGSLLMLVNPMLDDSNRIRPTGLDPVTARGGISMSSDFILERDPELVLPQGLGETFFVTPKLHEITAGLTDGFDVRYRPLLTAAQSLKTTSADSPAKPLLVTSKEAYSVKDIRPFVEEGRAVEKRAGDASGPFTVAMAAERGARSGKGHGPRMVVVGTTNVAFGLAWRDGTLLANRLFVESALAWLAAKPPIVSVPEKPSHAAGLSLTEDSLGEILRYVLLYMPCSALLLGGLLLFRRRSQERKSRSQTPKEKH